MFELLKKDVGMCRNVLIGAVLALLLPYVSVVVYTHSTGRLPPEQTNEMLALGLLGVSGTSVMLSVLSIAFLAGFAIAGERRDRSAEFLAYLPPKKSAILTSKAILCFAWMAVVALVYFLVADGIVPWLSGGEVAYEKGARQSTFVMIPVAFSVFGVAWLCSCCLESPVLAVLAGIVTPVAVTMFVYVLQLKFGWKFEQDVAATLYMGLFFLIGLAAFVGGWIHFVSRVEP